MVSREGLSGVRVIRAFSKQEEEQKRFEQAASEQTETAIGVGKLTALLNPLTYAVMNLAVVAILWFGGYRVDNGGASQGNVIAPYELYDANIACTHRGGKFGGYFYKSGGIRFQS
ncbi:MAG: ABC transporter transmembrane domain-containing protein [Eubacteriales bacterium]